MPSPAPHRVAGPFSGLLVVDLTHVLSGTLEQMVLIAALPPVFAGMILAVRYHAYVVIASSTLIVTMLLFAGAAPMWIAILRLLGA